MIVRREIEDTDLAHWLETVPEGVLAAYREAERRAAGASLLDLMEEMGEEAERNGLTAKKLAGLLEVDDDEAKALGLE